MQIRSRDGAYTLTGPGENDTFQGEAGNDSLDGTPHVGDDTAITDASE